MNEKKVNQTQPKQSNESISDSLAIVLENYDGAIKAIENEGFAGYAVSFWKTNIMQDSYIQKLRKLTERGGLVEADLSVAEEIKKIIKERKLNKEDDALANKAFDYLEKRLNYLDQRTRRSPYELTAEYKILLVGNGWVTRSHKDTKFIKEMMYAAKLNRNVNASYPDNQWYFEQMNLENCLYSPDQVYTVDINSCQLPDFLGNVALIQPGELPEKYFDFIYFEGFNFAAHEENEKALKVALATLKDDGLIIYRSPEPDCRLKITAKSGEITQEKLSKIPECIKKSVGRQFDIAPLEKVTEPGKAEIVFEYNSELLENGKKFQAETQTQTGIRL